jgi:hypothetical protein
MRRPPVEVKGIEEYAPVIPPRPEHDVTGGSHVSYDGSPEEFQVGDQSVTGRLVAYPPEALGDLIDWERGVRKLDHVDGSSSERGGELEDPLRFYPCRHRYQRWPTGVAVSKPPDHSIDVGNTNVAAAKQG